MPIDPNQLRQLMQQGQASPGASPAGAPMASPSPQHGNQVEAMAQVRQATKLLEHALPVLGSESPVGKAIMSAIKALSHHAPENKTTAGADSTVLRDLAAKSMQQGPLQALQRAQGQSQQGAPNG